MQVKGEGLKISDIYQGLQPADLTAAWVVSMQIFADVGSHETFDFSWGFGVFDLMLCTRGWSLVGLLCLYLSGKRFGSLSGGEDGRFWWWLLTKETGDTRFLIY